MNILNKLFGKETKSKQLDIINLAPTIQNPIIEFNYGSRIEKFETLLRNIFNILRNLPGIETIYGGYHKISTANQTDSVLTYMLNPTSLGYYTSESFDEAIAMYDYYKLYICVPIDNSGCLIENKQIDDLEFTNLIMTALKIKVQYGGLMNVEYYGKITQFRYYLFLAEGH
ncbi:MAG: hypothetical protein H8D23_07010 [Candidatus Brocadiales bacterium]|nr:hypothetical protein [Candidatus Brocadiales bacterium]